jgi:methionyl-tRNA formyltransferase
MEKIGNNFAFLGTPDFAAKVLTRLIDGGMSPAVVICNPDRPVGRKKILTPPPTKMIAEQMGIKVWQPEKLELAEWKKQVGEIDFAIVAAYAKIIKKEILDTAPKGFIGVHPSLLPKYRGASPIQSVLLAGEQETGVTLYMVDEKVDHGAILAQRTLAVADRNYEMLEPALAELGGDMLIETLPRFTRGEITPKVQDEAEATLTRKFKTEDGFVDLEKDDARTILGKIRGLNPEPGAFTFREGKRVKLLEAEWEGSKLKITRIQVEGEKPKSATIYR